MVALGTTDVSMSSMAGEKMTFLGALTKQAKDHVLEKVLDTMEADDFDQKTAESDPESESGDRVGDEGENGGTSTKKMTGKSKKKGKSKLRDAEGEHEREPRTTKVVETAQVKPKMGKAKSKAGHIDNGQGVVGGSKVVTTKFKPAKSAIVSGKTAARAIVVDESTDVSICPRVAGSDAPVTEEPKAEDASGEKYSGAIPTSQMVVEGPMVGVDAVDRDKEAAERNLRFSGWAEVDNSYPNDEWYAPPDAPYTYELHGAITTAASSNQSDDEITAERFRAVKIAPDAPNLGMEQKLAKRKAGSPAKETVPKRLRAVSPFPADAQSPPPPFPPIASEPFADTDTRMTSPSPTTMARPSQNSAIITKTMTSRSGAPGRSSRTSVVGQGGKLIVPLTFIFILTPNS